MLAATRSHLLYSPLILEEYGTSKLVIGERINRKKKLLDYSHSSDNGK